MRYVLIPHHLTQILNEPPSAGKIRVLNGQTMGTAWSVKYVDIPGLEPAELQHAIQITLDTMVAQMSTWREDSDISRFNQARSASWHVLPNDFFNVMECALSIAECTHGAFDPTIGSLVNLWGFGPETRSMTSLPTTGEISDALSRCGWQKLKLDRKNRRLLQPGSISIDFSGIAKGYGVDRICATLQKKGVQHYLVEIGGELSGSGIKPDGYPWWVTLERPPEYSGPEMVVALHNLAIATSGNYRRYFQHLDQYYAHTVDPETGWPVKNAPLSVTVLHEECMHADALATAITVMGLPTGLEFANRHGIAALILSGDKTTGHFSDALAAMLE